MIDWTTSPETAATIEEIVQRWETMQNAGPDPRPFDRNAATMDLVACHNHGCRLDLGRLRDADDLNFAHDVFGIRHHLDRKTGELGGCFVPRFALREATASH